MNRGHLIVLTGVDGSGKSTQAQRLISEMKQNGLDVFYAYGRWEPMLLRPLLTLWKNKLRKSPAKSDAAFYKYKIEKQKHILSNSFFRKIWGALFFVDYGLQLLIRIRMGLLKKRLIVSDRIFYDSIIDKAVDFGEDWLHNSLNSFWIKILFPLPDIVIYIDCPDEIAFSRKSDIPSLEYLAFRRKLYLDLAEKYNWVTVDGTLPVDEVASKVRESVYKKLVF